MKYRHSDTDLVNAAQGNDSFGDPTNGNDTYFDNPDYEYSDYLYLVFDFEIPIYGYIWPVLVIFTTCCNCLVIGGFLRRHMRNATNLILVAIAVSDSLTGLVTLPATFHIFADGNYFLTKDWCDSAMITRHYVSRAFHTVSIWETLLLGVYRLMQIRRPAMARTCCTVSKTLLGISIMYILSFTLHVYHAFDVKTNHGMCLWIIQEPCGWTCIYIWFNLFLCHIIPSLILVALAVSMVIYLFCGANHNAENNGLHPQRNMTLIVILVVVFFLIPELPYGVFYMATMCLKHTGQNIFPLRTNRVIHCVYELLLVVSFHLNFWIYCIMIRSFRNTVRNVFRLLTCRPLHFDHMKDEEITPNAGGLELAGVGERIGTEQHSH